MRKVKAICIYKDNRIYNLTALLGHSSVTLLQYDLEDTKTTPCSHDNFEDLYRDVLLLLRYNDMYCSHYREFNRDWYDIAFININNPTKVCKYSVSVKEGK